MNIAIIRGGTGSEREVSLQTSSAFEVALKSLKLSYLLFEADEYLTENLVKYKPDIALLAVHGKCGEDGVLQGVLEYLKMPYTGSGVLQSALCMDKALTKVCLSSKNIKSPKHIIIKSILDIHEAFTAFPCIVKPTSEGSSMGVTLVYDYPELVEAVKQALIFNDSVMLEEYIRGVECTVPIVNGKALTPIEIVPVTGIYDYKCKYTKGMTDYHIPPRIDVETMNEIKRTAELAFTFLDLNYYSRVDFIISEEGMPYFIEVNTLPGCTKLSLLPMAAKFDDIAFTDLVKGIVQSAKLHN